MTRITRNSIALAAILTSPACSLLYLDIQPGDCASFDECDDLNDRDGLDALSCELWTCDDREHVCVRRAIDRDGDGALGPYPGRTVCDYEPTDCDDRNPDRGPDEIEECDGVDNDCDLVIDDMIDAMASNTPTEERAPIGPLSTGVASPVDLAFPANQSASERMAMVAGREGDVSASSIDLESGSPPVRISWATYCTSGTLEHGCALGASCVMGEARHVCDAAEPTAGSVGAATWVAAVNTTGCDGGGEIRVGALSGTDIVVNSTAAGPGFPSCAGGPARAPTLAGLDGETALLTHLAEPFGLRTCGGATGVGGVVVTLGSDPRPGSVAQTGVVDLGMTAGASPTAILAVPEGSAWLVAFGSDGGGVALRWVGTDASVQALPSVGSGLAEGVRVSGGVVDGRVRLGVAWQGGCAGGPIQFASASIAVVAPTDVRMGPVVTLSPDGRAPAVVWRAEGLVERGYERGGVVATDLERGGWYVAWSSAQGVEMQRVLALDGLPISVPTDARPEIAPLRLLAGQASALWLARSATGRPIEAFALDSAHILHRLGTWCGPNPMR